MSEFQLTHDVKLIQIAGEVADEMGRRLSALRGAIECIRDKLAGARQGAAADALYGVMREIERIAVDLDVDAWDGLGAHAQVADAANESTS